MHVARRRSSARVGGVVCAAMIAAGACGGAPSEPRPVPSMASSPMAGAAFAEILDAWRDSEHTSPAVLRVLLERFIARFPTDGQTPLVRVYLALVALATGDPAEADRQLAATDKVPAGATRDLRTVANARRLRLQGDAEASMDLLRPLVGKAVDPISRAVFQEELALAALATQRDYEAISYMDAWLRTSTEEDKARTTAVVEALVAQVPKEVLVSALQAMRLQRASFGYGVDIERILAGRLAAIATETDDAELARLLLDPKAGTIVNAGDAGTELAELATSRRGLNVVAGHTVGLLLPTESPALRDEAAEVLRGVMWALGLPRGIRARADAARAPLPRAGNAGTLLHAANDKHEPCAPGEPAPALDEPRDAEALRLVTRDDAGSADRTEASLDELAGEGAALVIGALDAQTASRALHWGESHGVSVVALVPPAEGVAAGGFGFVLGEPRESVLDALVRAVPSLAGERAAPILDESQLSFFPPEGGRVGPLTATPPISCDVPATVAGEPRFPIADFLHDKVRAWLVVGPATCAKSLTAELSAARAQGVVALSLEAASLPAHAASLRVVTASAGVIPRDAIGDPDDELHGFSERLGALDWWSALGRDAATLARIALNGLPADTVGEAHAVANRRARARDLLASARVRLWSTEATGWSDTRSMKRTLCAMDAPSEPSPHR